MYPVINLSQMVTNVSSVHDALAAFNSKKQKISNPSFTLYQIRTKCCDSAHPCGSDVRKQIGAFPNMSNYSLEYVLTDLGSGEVRACNGDHLSVIGSSLASCPNKNSPVLL